MTGATRTRPVWLGRDTPDAMQPYSSGFARTYCEGGALPAELRMISVSTTLSGAELTDGAGILQPGGELARRALDHRPLNANPRPIPGIADVKEILELAW